LAQEVQRLLTEVGILPEVLPENFTFRKVRELLDDLEKRKQDELVEAIKAAQRLQVRGPLAALIFIKHHLDGAHEVEVDRLEEGEEGTRFSVLIYPEGELPVLVKFLPEGVHGGSKLHYDPSEEIYR
jgi:hypothetical protein